MNIPPATLPPHVVFRELPFCGVLLDTRTMRVYRLSQSATAVLRQALPAAPATGPYEPVVAVTAPPPDSAPARRLLSGLAARHLLRLRPGHGDDR